jgi:hypothetical protein
MKNAPGQCNICRKEYTSVHVEVMPGIIVYVCSRCLELKRAYMLCEGMLIIQGIDMCIACNPEKILEYIETQQLPMEC